MTSPAMSYGKLLSETQPEVVRSEAQNQLYIQKLEELTAIHLSPLKLRRPGIDYKNEFRGFNGCLESK